MRRVPTIPLNILALLALGVVLYLAEENCNGYQLQIMNMTEAPRAFRLEVSGLPGVRIGGEQSVDVAPASHQSVTLQVLVPYDSGQPGANKIAFQVTAEDDPALTLNEETTFLIPR